MQSRILWLDAARGIGISLVVFGHALRGINGSQAIPGASELMPLDQVIYAFHMPLFFMLAGLLAPIVGQVS